MSELLLVKFGGSLITEKSKPFTERLDVIRRLSQEIHGARQETDARIVIGHGGGSYPHQPAKDYGTHNGINDKRGYEGIAKVQDAAARLNRIVVSQLIESGEKAMSIQPSAAFMIENKRVIEWYTKPIEKLLEYGMLPVVYGDVGLDIATGSCIVSTEELFRFLGKELGAARIIMCGKTDGVFTGDPNNDSSAKHIPEITQKNFGEISKHLDSSDGIDVTGGMSHKIKRALELAESGAPVHIINGNKPGNLKDAVLGKPVKETVIR